MQICEHVHGLYLLEVRLNGYENRDGKCIGCPRRMNTDASSCYDDFGRFGDCNHPDRACDSYFIFCLKTFGTWRERYNCQQNYEGTRVISVNVNDALLDYTYKTVLGLENPFLLPGLTEEYKVSSLARFLISFQHYNSCLDLTVSYNYQGVQLYIVVE